MCTIDARMVDLKQIFVAMFRWQKFWKSNEDKEESRIYGYNLPLQSSSQQNRNYIDNICKKIKTNKILIELMVVLYEETEIKMFPNYHLTVVCCTTTLIHGLLNQFSTNRISVSF